MGDVNLEIKLGNLDERVIKIEESGGGSGGNGYITSVSNDFNVVNKKLSLSNNVTTKLSKVDTTDNLSVELAKKIDKPASATDGQVLTYNGTSNEWEAQDSKGGGGTPITVDSGMSSWSPSIQANSYYDMNITFNKKFEKAPYVVVSYRGSSENTDIGITKIFAVVIGTTTSSATIRIFNTGTENRAILLNWIAVRN